MPGRPLAHADHHFCGTYSSYVRNGCRCPDCRTAARNVQRKRRGLPPVTRQDLYQLPELAPLGAWVEQAACKGMDINRFFPEVGGRGIPEVVKVCQGCPVRQECLDDALTNKTEHGVWGGLSAKQRKAIWKKWREDVA